MKNVFFIIALLFSLNANSQDDKYGILGDYELSADLGYASKGFMLMNIAISINNWYYGFDCQINTDTGTKGKSYNKIIDWDNDLDNVSNSGSYYSGSYGINIGYYFKENFCFGSGIGYSPHDKYRNFHDSSNILSSDGWYNVTKSDGGKIDSSIFANYYFKKTILGRGYIKCKYSFTSGLGFGLGYKF